MISAEDIFRNKTFTMNLFCATDGLCFFGILNKISKYPGTVNISPVEYEQEYDEYDNDT
ncbi:hypothetical protein C900_05749 [Fulvivirga imtechensis AK7]|uniref:Uncharacterized protein n=1 Tax=Fulvivirga imtechensis AK7 TaxID=1237149 RepID=L8JZM1_9BACT|nr:hypothetical protein C900_05749 [Fulvivirga imtechensis AK7]